ncbi:fumarate reductase subunit C [Bradyrhizobium sp. HKCCYLS1011]|uniref:fumarate reductase subunit C n=1 Tax=Bradyrhizobium sp. HKCCYLS1011 TaxID=3420733 RepID=UPI003EC08B69
MSERRPYLRPQPRDWWAHPPYRAYTIRELCGVALALYAAVLLAGLICLARGPEAYEAFRRFLASPVSLVLHLALLAAALWHMWTWFQILPKTLPKLVWRGKLVRQQLITTVATVLAAGCSAVLVLLIVIIGVWS